MVITILLFSIETHSQRIQPVISHANMQSFMVSPLNMLPALFSSRTSIIPPATAKKHLFAIALVSRLPPQSVWHLCFSELLHLLATCDTFLDCKQQIYRKHHAIAILSSGSRWLPPAGCRSGLVRRFMRFSFDSGEKIYSRY